MSFISKKIFLLLFFLTFISGCVGTIEDKNPKPSKTGEVSKEQVSFAGISEAIAISNSKVRLSFFPASGSQSDLVYLIYVNGSLNPIEVNGGSLAPDLTGALSFTANNLSVNTNYSFSVGVLDTRTGIKTENNKVLFAKTFSNYTADFSGISSVKTAAGEAGKTEVVVEWVPATTLGTSIAPRSGDPVAYEIRFMKASDGTPNELRNPASPVVTVKREPSTISTNPSLSVERSRPISGLEPGTRYYFLVRCYHKAFGQFQELPGYKVEENFKVLSVTTVDNSGFMDWDSESIKVESVPGELGLSQIDLSWSNASGPFDHYRLYNVKVANNNETLVDAEANAPDFDTDFFQTKNDADEYVATSADDSFYRLKSLDSYAYYKATVVTCGNASCDATNRIVGSPRIFRVTPTIAPFSGLLSINNPTSLDEINQGDDSIDTITVLFDPPVMSAGYVNKMELYCFSSLTDTTPMLLEAGNTTDNSKDGCKGITRITETPSTVTQLGSFTTIEISSDFIKGSDKVSDRQYCFGVIPVIEDTTSGYEVRDISNAIVKCKFFEITVPKIKDFAGAESFCQTSGTNLTVSWKKPTGGVYEHYEIFYKENDGEGFKFEDAIKDLNDAPNLDKYNSIDVSDKNATSAILSGLESGKSYTYGVLTYLEGAPFPAGDPNAGLEDRSKRTYSDFNGGINTCQIAYPIPRFKEWVDIFAIGPKIDGRVPLEPQAEGPSKATTFFETLNNHGIPIEVEVDETLKPTTDFENQFGSVGTSVFPGIYGKPDQDTEKSGLYRYSNSGIIRIAWKDIVFKDGAVTKSMAQVIDDESDDTNNKGDRKYGYRVYRSSDLGVNWIDLTKDSAFQNGQNSGLIHPVDFSERPRINAALSTFKVGQFIDYSVKALHEVANKERARVYLYKVIPVFNGVELAYTEQEDAPEHIIKVTLPPPNMGLIHRLMANRQTCMELGKSYLNADGEADFLNHYACDWNGVGAVGRTEPYKVGEGETVYDFKSDMLIDRFEMGCDYTRGHQANTDSYFPGSMDDLSTFDGLASSGAPFKGCLMHEDASDPNDLGKIDGSIADPSDPGPWADFKRYFVGDCIQTTTAYYDGGTSLCADDARVADDAIVTPGAYKDGNDTCENGANFTSGAILDPYTGAILQRQAQSEFMAVAYHARPINYDSRYVYEWRGAGGEFDSAKRVKTSGLNYRNSRCSINIPVEDGGNQVARWVPASSLSDLTHDGVDIDILDKTVSQVKSMVGSLFGSSGTKEALPTNTESWNGRFDDNTPMAKIISSNNAKLPPLQGVNATDAGRICRSYQVEIGVKPEEGDFSISEGTFSKRLMRRPDGIVANAFPKTFDETYSDEIATGTTGNSESPVTSGSSFNPSCNAYNRAILGTNNHGGPGSVIKTRMPRGSYGSSGNGRVELITGSSFYDPEGINYSTQHCVSRYGVQDVIGNNREISSEKYFCYFDDEFLYYGTDGDVTNSVQESQVGLLSRLFDGLSITPWVLSGTDTGQCSMVESGAVMEANNLAFPPKRTSYSPTQGGSTMVPLYDPFGNLNTNIVSAKVYDDPGFRNFWRNGDGYFLDFGQSALAPPISVNDTLALRFDGHINGRVKEAGGDPRQGQYFNPILGIPIMCGGTSCTATSSDNRSISTTGFVSKNGLAVGDLAVSDFPIQSSNIQSDGMSEITVRARYNLSRDYEGTVDFVDAIFPNPGTDPGTFGNAAGGRRNDVTINWDDPAYDGYVLSDIFWDLARTTNGVAFFNFGGAQANLGTGRYSLALESMNENTQESLTTSNSFRCVVKINEDIY